MREIADQERILQFLQRFGAAAKSEVDVYITGGSTAVLMGWRPATVDIDLRFVPERDELFRAIPKLKEELRINLELASPSDFIPELPDWRLRCQFITRIRKAAFFHYDLYSQALSKIERGHQMDRRDVDSMLREGLINPETLISLFHSIEPMLYKYPAIDPKSFRESVMQVVSKGL